MTRHAASPKQAQETPPCSYPGSPARSSPVLRQASSSLRAAGAPQVPAMMAPVRPQPPHHRHRHRRAHPRPLPREAETARQTAAERPPRNTEAAHLETSSHSITLEAQTRSCSHPSSSSASFPAWRSRVSPWRPAATTRQHRSSRWSRPRRTRSRPSNSHRCEFPKYT